MQPARGAPRPLVRADAARARGGRGRVGVVLLVAVGGGAATRGPPTPAPTPAVSALFPAPEQPLVGPSSVLHHCSSSAATSPNMNISMVHPLNNKTCKGWERAVLNNLCNSVGGP